MKTKNDVLLLYKGNDAAYYEVDRNVDIERWEKLIEPGEEYLLISSNQDKLSYLPEGGLSKKDLFDLIKSNSNSIAFESTNDPLVFNFCDILERQYLMQNSHASRQVLYVIDGNMLREVARDSDQDWIERKEETLNNREKYFCLEIPDSSRELNRNVLWELQDGLDILKSIIIGENKEFGIEDFKNILLHPDTPLKAISTNDTTIASWYRDQVDYCERTAKNLRETDYDAQKYYEAAAKKFKEQSDNLKEEINKNIIPEKMQVIVVNDKGLLIELATQLDSQKFLQQHEIENIAKSLIGKYPDGKVMAIETDREKYLGIKGISPDVVKLRDKHLKEEGVVIYNCDVPREIREAKISKQQKKRSESSQAIDNVVKKEDRNIIDIIQSYLDISIFILKDLFVILKDLFTKGKKDINKILKNDKAKDPEDVLQVVTVELKDGNILELKSEKNKNLFLQQGDLKAYAEDVINVNGKFRLIEIPKDKFPDAGKYLEKGIMTEEGKKRYQAEKEAFFKSYGQRSVVYEINGKPEKGKAEEQKISQSTQKKRIEFNIKPSQAKNRTNKMINR